MACAALRCGRLLCSTMHRQCTTLEQQSLCCCGRRPRCHNAAQPQAQQQWDCRCGYRFQVALPAALCHEARAAAHQCRALPSWVAAVGGPALHAACTEEGVSLHRRHAPSPRWAVRECKTPLTLCCTNQIHGQLQARGQLEMASQCAPRALANALA